MESNSKAKLNLVISMLIFGTIGIFRRYIPLSSSTIACARGVIGTIFLLIYARAIKSPFSYKKVKHCIIPLSLSGVFIGINWILLFEAYRFTTVATATLCYYMAPIFVMMVSPILLKEKASAKKLICIAVAFIGMVLVSGIIGTEISGFEDVKGILLGLGAAAFYASVIIVNKKITGVNAYDKTIVQLAFAAAVALPYTFIAGNIATGTVNALAVAMLIFVGIVHTGITYALYFGSLDSIKAETVAIMSYIDPAVAILLSASILHETMGIYEIIGAILILGSSLISEITPDKTKQ